MKLSLQADGTNYKYIGKRKELAVCLKVKKKAGSTRSLNEGTQAKYVRILYMYLNFRYICKAFWSI